MKVSGLGCKVFWFRVSGTPKTYSFRATIGVVTYYSRKQINTTSPILFAWAFGFVAFILGVIVNASSFQFAQADYLLRDTKEEKKTDGLGFRAPGLYLRVQGALLEPFAIASYRFSETTVAAAQKYGHSHSKSLEDLCICHNIVTYMIYGGLYVDTSIIFRPLC